MRTRKIILGVSYTIITSILVILICSCHSRSSSYVYETVVVKKGSIINTITATGTIEADTTVLIGTQVSGVIKKIFVDFNSVVKKGQLLAQLDTTPLQTEIRQAEASLDDSRGEVEYQRATYERYQELFAKNLIAKADYDQVKYNYNKALSDLKTAKATYDKAVVNLGYASIYSPILGVILNRAVDQGQTVAASFSTPNLFTIANDLTQMHVEAAVDEADIGLVRASQPVDFTVDAYPYETFKGSVRQVRLQPVVTSNVVTYTVIVNAPNPDKKLMPGMTANITVLVQKVDSVLLIPGRAIRFTPDAAFLAGYFKKNFPGRNQRTGGPERPRTNGAESLESANPFANTQSGKRPVVAWVKSGDLIQRSRITTGAMDATNVEVKSGLKEGEIVILSMTLSGGSPVSNAAPATSPFMPQRPGTRR